MNNELTKSTIGEISIEVKTGKTPPTKDEDNYAEGKVNWFTPSDFKGYKILNSSKRKITNIAVEKNKAFLFPPETIMITGIGEIGKVGIIKNLASCNQQVTGVRVKNEIILSDYFYYWVLRNKDLLRHYANYAVIPILNNKVLRRVPIIYHKDKKTQLKVVTQLDKIQSLIEKRRKVISFLKKLELSSFIQIFGDPILNTKGWDVEKLDFFGDWRSGGTPPRNVKNYFERGTIPWFNSGELNNLFISKSNISITKKAIEETNVKKVEAGSLMIGMYDTAALKTSIANVECSCNQAIAFSHIDISKGIPLFILFCLKISKDHLLKKRKGARQKNFNLSTIKNLNMINPPLEIQTNFKSIILKLEAIIKHHEKSLVILEQLFLSTLNDTFNPETQVDERTIFENLLQSFTLYSFKEKEQRIDYLIDYLSNEKFENLSNYNIAKDFLLALLNEKVVTQVFDIEKNKILTINEATEA